MGIFSGSGRKNPAAMLEKAKGLKERAFEADSAGELLDYPVAVNDDVSSWEVHYVLHVSKEVFSQLTTSPQIIVSMAAAEMNAQGVPLLCILVRLNNKNEYSYAMVARASLFGEKGSELESLNYAKILLEQRTFTLKISYNGKSLSSTITNPLHNSPYMMKIREHLDNFLSVKGNNYRYEDSSRNLRFAAQMETYGKTGFSSMSEYEVFGQLLWSKYPG